MSQVIIRRKAGQSIPEDFLSLCPTKVFGVAVIDGNKLETPHGTDFTLEALRSTEEDYKDVPFTLYLSDAEKATNLNDVSPYDLIGDADDNSLLSVCIDGEFPGFAKTGSSQSPAYHLAGFIAEHCETIFDAVDKDLAKLMLKIGEDRFKEKIKMNAVSRGYLTFVAQNGACVSIAQGDTEKEFPWGWVSNHFGYGVEEKKEPEKKKGLFSRSSTREKHVPPSSNVQLAGADKPPKTETAIPKTTDTGSNNPTKPTPKPVILTLENITVKKMKAPESFNRRAKKAWFKERLGHIPPTWQNPDQIYEVYTGPTGAVLTKKEIATALGVSGTQLPVLKNPRAERQEDISAANIDMDKAVPNPLPMLSKNGRDRMHRLISDERIKKIISENAVMISDPDQVQNHEAKIPLFAQQLGMKDMKDFDCLPFIELERLGRNDIHDLATMAWTWKCRALGAEHKLGKNKPVKAETDLVKETEVKKPGLFARRAAA